MPALLTRLTRQLASKGVPDAKGLAIGLLEKRGHLQNGKLTPAGRVRQSMGAGGRAKDRAAKASGGNPSEYKYNKQTNRATKSK